MWGCPPQSVRKKAGWYDDPVAAVYKGYHMSHASWTKLGTPLGDVEQGPRGGG